MAGNSVTDTSKTITVNTIKNQIEPELVPESESEPELILPDSLPLTNQ